jgi:2-methylcitrate dehydratase PrpD
MSPRAPLTSALAEFVAGFDARDLPGEVRDRTLTLVLDGSGALRAASNPAYSTGRLIAGFVRDLSEKGTSSVIGHGFRTGCVDAALANGTMGYACDVEPHHPEAILHSVAVMVPTALAVGERVGASGARFLNAIALGLEVEYRASMALGPAEQYALGFHPSAVCGCCGATAAAACLLGLDAEATARAFGLAACQASGLMAWESEPTENSRPFQMGVAARNGITAALLAQQGFGGPAAVFDHGHTVFKAFSREPSPALLTEGLGERFAGVMEMAIKPYSCCAFLHPGLDALRELIREHGITPGDIEAIDLHFPESGCHCIDGNPLKSHSAQYTFAVVAGRGELGVADLFIDRREEDPVVADLARRVRVVHDHGVLEGLFPDFYASEVELRTKGGDTLRKRHDIARGYPEAPLGEAEIQAKLAELAGTVAPPERVEALRDVVTALPEAADLTAYADLMREPAGR